MLKKIILAGAIAIASLVSAKLVTRAHSPTAPVGALAGCEPQTCQFGGRCGCL